MQHAGAVGEGATDWRAGAFRRNQSLENGRVTLGPAERAGGKAQLGPVLLATT